MRNFLLDRYAAADIDQFVARALADLGNPDPPLNLTRIRELLRLDRAYYSSTDDAAIRQVAHKLSVAGQDVITRPTVLKDVVSKLGLKALLLPERRCILIDSEVPDLKQRWSEAHEIGHDLIPWHAGTMFGDNKATLTPACHRKIEAEANYAAGQLLFFKDRFIQEACTLPPGFDSLTALTTRYENTITTTLWRYVELNPGLAVGAISDHPRRTRQSFSARNPLRCFIRSRSFQEQFPGVTEADVFAGIRAICSDSAGGLIGNGSTRFFDARGDAHVFQMETFFNRYEALTLGWASAPGGNIKYSESIDYDDFGH